MAEHVVPVAEVEALASKVAIVAALALIQADGDPDNANARLESMRGKVAHIADTGRGYKLDVIQVAQEAILAAATDVDGAGT